MKPDRWREVDRVFEGALEREGADRIAFLDRACAGDLPMRREVEKMLKFDEQAGDFIEKDVFDVAAGLITGRSLPTEPMPPTFEQVRSVRKSQSSFPSLSIDDARFIPGEVLADRYRIVGLLGRGGMGEVYRADDLKLKQSVALKFLPERFSSDGAALARFYREVSVARGISHHHVCRVYDVAEFEGQHFISMEFVRGEELGSLLMRIGRLPQDKAVEISRQLCAGLSAIHDKGVLHRDLKPANIMIDERGDVRVTDFGIAALAEEVRGREAMAGTLAYMSPEQLEGRELTIKSDIFTLGVVLYEIFTGKKAFTAPSQDELLRLRHSNTQPSSPSEVLAGLDPLVERVINRCLERDPEKRPATALQVAAALPGGDPLAAALAAGETPSPEMVAAAPKEGVLRPAVAVSLLASVLVLMALVCFFSKDVGLFSRVPLNKSPDVLRDRAAEISKRLGYSETAGDSAYGMSADMDYLQFIHANDPSQTRWDRLRSGQPAAIYFWHKHSPVPLRIDDAGVVTENSPLPPLAGATQMTLDTLGHLRSFRAVPPHESSSVATVNSDWSILFNESGLDQTRLTSVAPIRTPPYPYTARAAWEGSYPDQPDTRMRVEAAMFEGRPVFFEIFDAWDIPPNQAGYMGSTKERALTVLLLSVFITCLVGSGFLAWRNLRLGRGDRKGAARLGGFLLIVFFINWVLSAHHVATEIEAFHFISMASGTVFWSFFFWVVYLAFEPFVRRRWPGRIISWTRLLAGGWRDPLVGRDILLGALFGTTIIFVTYCSYIVPHWLGKAPALPWFDSPATRLLGLRSLPFGVSYQIFASLTQPFIILFILFMFRVVLRRDLLAALGAGTLAALALSLVQQDLHQIPFAILSAVLVVFCLYRFGLLALVAATYFLHLNIFFPITSDFTAWYAADFVVALIIALGLAVYAFYISLAGQPLFKSKLLED
ncbi:MAG TPA: serine/threonine-protein kinase [Pyrinomonadaceae bacterium]|nr:serine/threonine-protein kinase [Pyrinomonadaceae bacterium]